MSKLKQLHRMAERQNVGIYECSMELSPALSVRDESGCYIAIDSKRLKTDAERTVALAHEVGHCKKGAFYNVNNSLDIMDKHELKANKWAALFLLPKKKLLRAAEAGIREPFEIAEYFNVTEDFVKIAIDIFLLDDKFSAEVEKMKSGQRCGKAANE